MLFAIFWELGILGLFVANVLELGTPMISILVGSWIKFVWGDNRLPNCVGRCSTRYRIDPDSNMILQYDWQNTRDDYKKILHQE